MGGAAAMNDTLFTSFLISFSFLYSSYLLIKEARKKQKNKPGISTLSGWILKTLIIITFLIGVFIFVFTLYLWLK